MTMRVATILDPYSAAITNDSTLVNVGDIVAIAAEYVIDPETGQNLGSYPKSRLKVTEVYDRFFVAATYRLVNYGDDFRIQVSIGDIVTLWRSL